MPLVAVLLKANDGFEDSTSSPNFELVEQIIIQTIMISQLLAKARILYFVSWDWRENLSKYFQYLLVVLPNMVSLD